MYLMVPASSAMICRRLAHAMSTSKRAERVMSEHSKQQLLMLAYAHLLGGLLQTGGCLRQLGGDVIVRSGQLW
jgi:hypothetical protein